MSVDTEIDDEVFDVVISKEPIDVSVDGSINVPVPENMDAVSETLETVEVSEEVSVTIVVEEFVEIPVAGNIPVVVSVTVDVEKLASEYGIVDASVDKPSLNVLSNFLKSQKNPTIQSHLYSARRK